MRPLQVARRPHTKSGERPRRHRCFDVAKERSGGHCTSGGEDEDRRYDAAPGRDRHQLTSSGRRPTLFDSSSLWRLLRGSSTGRVEFPSRQLGNTASEEHEREPGGEQRHADAKQDERRRAGVRRRLTVTTAPRPRRPAPTPTVESTIGTLPPAATTMVTSGHAERSV